MNSNKTTIKNIGRHVVRALMAKPIALRSAKVLVKAGIIPRPIWRMLPVDATFSVGIGEARFLYRSSAYDSIGRILFWAGPPYWEFESTRIFSTLCRHSNLVLDIGANTGIYTLLALSANPDSQVVAFEPVPELRKYLMNNLEANGYSDRCVIQNCAVSDTEGRTKFHVPDLPLPTTSSLHSDGFRGIAGQLIDVDVKTVDNVIAEDQTIDLVKLDIEGFEDRALKGMTRILGRDKPIIMLECNPDGPAREIEYLLRPFGYSFFHLRAAGPVPTDNIDPDEECHFRNFLCVPANKLAILQSL